MDLDEIIETFEALDNGEERYRYLIELGRSVPELPESQRTEEHRVHGCQSRVWMTASLDEERRLHLAADSDAFIVRGLIAILLALFSGRTTDEVLAIDAAAVFDRIGLAAQLSMGRRNGLFSMVQRVRLLAGGQG